MARHGTARHGAHPHALSIQCPTPTHLQPPHLGPLRPACRRGVVRLSLHELPQQFARRVGLPLVARRLSARHGTATATNTKAKATARAQSQQYTTQPRPEEAAGSRGSITGSQSSTSHHITPHHMTPPQRGLVGQVDALFPSLGGLHLWPLQRHTQTRAGTCACACVCVCVRACARLPDVVNKQEHAGVGGEVLVTSHSRRATCRRRIIG